MYRDRLTLHRRADRLAAKQRREVEVPEGSFPFYGLIGLAQDVWARMLGNKR